MRAASRRRVQRQRAFADRVHSPKQTSCSMRRLFAFSVEALTFVLHTAVHSFVKRARHDATVLIGAATAGAETIFTTGAGGSGGAGVDGEGAGAGVATTGCAFALVTGAGADSVVVVERSLSRCLSFAAHPARKAMEKPSFAPRFMFTSFIP